MSYVVTIDGPAGAGKSTVARRLARSLGIHYLDTGAIYRAVALVLEESEIQPQDHSFIKEALEKIQVELHDGAVLVNGLDVSAEIRTPEVEHIVSAYSALEEVREALLGLQRDQARFGSLVAEGRDLGSVVFPDASLKFFLTASPEARARRRAAEREAKGEPMPYEEVLAAIKERDRFDSARAVAPLRQPEGAVVVDSSNMSEDQTAAHIETIVRAAIERGEVVP